MGLVHFGARTHAQRARTREFFIFNLYLFYDIIEEARPIGRSGFGSRC